MSNVSPTARLPSGLSPLGDDSATTTPFDFSTALQELDPGAAQALANALERSGGADAALRAAALSLPEGLDGGHWALSEASAHTLEARKGR